VYILLFNSHVKFLAGRTDRQSARMSKIKKWWVRPLALNPLNSSNLEQLALKGLCRPIQQESIFHWFIQWTGVQKNAMFACVGRCFLTLSIWQNVCIIIVVVVINVNIAFSLNAHRTVRIYHCMRRASADGVTSQVWEDVSREVGQQVAAACLRRWRHRAGLPSRRTLSASAWTSVMDALHAVIRQIARTLHRVRLS